MIKSKIVILILLITVKPGRAQLWVDTSRSVDEVVRNILIGKHEGFKIQNIEYTGDKKSFGVFNCQMKYNNLFNRGVILSTGNIFDAKGPNSDPNTSSKSLINEDSDLGSLANGKTFDAAILEFDFIPAGDSICFNFFFASEEYPEYVKKNVNDVFGFFISSKELNTSTNLAVIEDNIPITVDNINATTNSKYFIENLKWDSGNFQGWNDNKQGAELAFTFQFDGFTTVLKAGTQVATGKTYHIKIAIADVGDRLYDSAIFLEAGSFKSVSVKTSIEQLVTNEFAGTTVTHLNSGISVNLNVNFEADSFKVAGAESFALLAKILKILNSDTTMRVEIIGHTDDSGKKEYNKTLSLSRAKNVADYLILKGVEPDRIKYEGYGDTRPISQTEKSLNRRVEFVFIKEEP